MIQLLAERADRIALLEARVENLDQLVEGYRSREQSVVDALSNAHVAAKQRMEDAEQKASAILNASQSRADKAIYDAQHQADTVLNEAQSQADKLLQNAKSESERMLQQAEATLAEYEAVFRQYNEALDRSVRQAKAGAEEYAAFLQSRKLESGDAALFAAEDLSGALPDPSDSPAQLMQNIYRLQNRDIPAEAPAVRPAPAVEPAPIDEPAPVAEIEVEIETVPEPEPAPKPLTTPAPKPVYEAADERPFAADEAYVPEAEWLPSEDVPTVSTLVSDIGDDDVSLDQLLDEIICSGE